MNEMELAKQYCRAGDLDGLSTAIRDFDANETDEHGCTLAHYAAESGDILVLDYLLRHTDADFFKADADELSTLHWACMGGQVHAVKWITTNFPQLIPLASGYELTALHYAAECNNVDVLKHLFSVVDDSQLLKEDALGSNPLHVALASRNIAAVKVLTDEIRSRHPTLPFDGIVMFCIRNGDKNTLHALLQTVRGDAASLRPPALPHNRGLDIAISMKKYDIIEYLINTGQLMSEAVDVRTVKPATLKFALHCGLPFDCIMGLHTTDASGPRIASCTFSDMAYADVLSTVAQVRPQHAWQRRCSAIQMWSAWHAIETAT